MTERHPDGQVVVQVVEVSAGREISWSGHAVERLSERLADVQAAIVAGARAVGQSLEEPSGSPGWRMDEVSATFGITLAAGAGVVLAKASTEATFEVTVVFRRS